MHLPGNMTDDRGLDVYRVHRNSLTRLTLGISGGVKRLSLHAVFRPLVSPILLFSKAIGTSLERPFDVQERRPRERAAGEGMIALL